MQTETSPLRRTWNLIRDAADPPPGRARIAVALGYGVLCHAVFVLGTGSMIVAMYFGMSRSLGTVPWPWAGLVNALLLLQFPLVHSALLSGPGRRLLARVVPGRHGDKLGWTTYAIVAGAQLFLLFALWTPSGIVWWQAGGGVRVLLTGLYAAAWLSLIWSDANAGVELQSGALGWLSMVRDKPAEYPAMPTTGPFRLIRQPIYLSFALTLWTVPVWTPDQLAIAVTYTAYCLLAPRRKERRYARMFGDDWRAYRDRTGYMIPALSKDTRP